MPLLYHENALDILDFLPNITHYGGMSGHSHWAGIKHKKALVDAKRSKLFSKLAKIISVAAREKGGDPAMNPRLRIAMETAQKANMPKENVERAIKRGTGELEGAKLEEITLEVYGPQGVAILVEGITDNKNRTLNEIKSILSGHGAKLANEGGVKWMFAQRGTIYIRNEENSKKKEGLELAAIDAGAEDFIWAEDTLSLITAPEKLESVKHALENLGIKIESASLEWVAKNPIDVAEEKRAKLEKLFEALDDYEDVQEIYSNLK
jgi:YebC/PmpR family DNA-binding regulatory protein